jgi:hypothetical protein
MTTRYDNDPNPDQGNDVEERKEALFSTLFMLVTDGLFNEDKITTTV